MSPEKSVRWFMSSVFFHYLSFGLIVPTLVYWQSSMGLLYQQIGVIQSVGFLTLLVMEVPSSYLADKKSHKLTVLLGCFFLFLNFVFLSIAVEFWFFLIAQICLSLGMALSSGTQESWLFSFANESQKLNPSGLLSRMQITDELGVIVGLGCSSLIISLSSPPHSFMAGAVSMILSTFFLLPLQDKTHPQKSLEERPFISLIKNKPSHWIWIAMGLVGLAFVAERGELLFQGSFKNAGLAIGNLGWLYILGKLCSILGSLIAPWVKDWKLPDLWQYLMVGTLQVIGFCLLFLLHPFWGVAGLCLFFFTENILRNLLKSRILSDSPAGTTATLLSVISFSNASIALFIRPITGGLFDLNPLIAVALVVVLKVLGLLLLFSAGNKPLFRKTNP